MRKYCLRTHGQSASFKVLLLVEERHERQHAYEKKHRKKKQAAKCIQAIVSERSCLIIVDANTRSVHIALNPIVVYVPSLIEGAGNCLFAAVHLQAGDIVTRYEGEIVDRARRPRVCN
jgi:hypothetical protein